VCGKAGGEKTSVTCGGNAKVIAKLSNQGEAPLKEGANQEVTRDETFGFSATGKGEEV